MLVRPCPHCRNPAAQLLDHSSAHAHVWYFRCSACGHVFAVHRNNPSGTPWTVARGSGPESPDQGDPESA